MTIESAAVVEQPTIDQDNPWKRALEFYFRDFMECCLPDIAETIDWSKGYVLLDKELHQIAKESEVGRRFADQLVKVWNKQGQETWILCHLEIQGNYEKAFPERMLVYRYRIRDRYHRPVVSIALLIDGNPRWRPDSYRESCGGSYLEVRYRVVKLLDYETRLEELEALNTPFAIVMLAQLAVLRTRGNPSARLQEKTALTRKLYEQGWGKEQIMQLYHLLDWLIALPKELVVEYQQKVDQLEGEKDMRYISSLERLGMEKGFQQGLEQGLQKGEATLLIRQLQHRFHYLPDSYITKIQQANDSMLLTWGERLLDATALEDIFD